MRFARDVEHATGLSRSGYSHRRRRDRVAERTERHVALRRGSRWEFGDKSSRARSVRDGCATAEVEQDLRRRMRRRPWIIARHGQWPLGALRCHRVRRRTLLGRETGGPLACPKLRPHGGRSARRRLVQPVSYGAVTPHKRWHRARRAGARGASRRRSRDGARRSDDRRSIGRSQPSGWRRVSTDARRRTTHPVAGYTLPPRMRRTSAFKSWSAAGHGPGVTGFGGSRSTIACATAIQSALRRDSVALHRICRRPVRGRRLLMVRSPNASTATSESPP